MTLFDFSLGVVELPSGGLPDNSNYDVASYAAEKISPCEYFACPNAKRCKEKQLACKSFSKFIRCDRAKLSPPSAPSRAIFRAIYDEDDDE